MIFFTTSFVHRFILTKSKCSNICPISCICKLSNICPISCCCKLSNICPISCCCKLSNICYLIKFYNTVLWCFCNMHFFRIFIMLLASGISLIRHIVIKFSWTRARATQPCVGDGLVCARPKWSRRPRSHAWGMVWSGYDRSGPDSHAAMRGGWSGRATTEVVPTATQPCVGDGLVGLRPKWSQRSRSHAWGMVWSGHDLSGPDGHAAMRGGWSGRATTKVVPTVTQPCVGMVWSGHEVVPTVTVPKLVRRIATYGL